MHVQLSLPTSSRADGRVIAKNKYRPRKTKQLPRNDMSFRDVQTVLAVACTRSKGNLLKIVFVYIHIRKSCRWRQSLQKLADKQIYVQL